MKLFGLWPLNSASNAAEGVIFDNGQCVVSWPDGKIETFSSIVELVAMYGEPARNERECMSVVQFADMSMLQAFQQSKAWGPDDERSRPSLQPAAVDDLRKIFATTLVYDAVGASHSTKKL